MLKFELAKDKNEELKILCLGAHSDDIEIGCGGTILKLLSEYSNVELHWVVFSANDVRSFEAKKSAELFLSDAREIKVIVKKYKDSFFPYIGAEIKDYFEIIKEEVSPDLIFTHCRDDLHQDHRLISELTWNTFRDHLILEYEIPKYDGDLGCPNFFVHLKKSICSRKVKHLIDAFKSQHENHWFKEESFLSILRLRGIESNAPGGYAEAFYSRKLIFMTGCSFTK